ncbi:MAG: Ldh family oxidoreductase [Rhizobiaceae bacterium]
MTDETVTMSVGEALALCEAAARGAGAREELAHSIALAAVDAEAEGQPNVGLSHFVDYLESLVAGRIDGQAMPVIDRPALTLFRSDARGGAAHTGFDIAFDDIVSAASTLGLAAFVQRNAYTAGALGYFPRRLAEKGLVAFAATNGPALIAAGGSTRPVFCTNPIAFAFPMAARPPLLIDQSSSATAFVTVRQAAASGEPLPEGWAIDAHGRPTTDASEAMRGALLAFGGARGSNIALMVDMLAAGVAGGKWSLDAGSITDGSESPGSGLFVVAIAPALIDPDFAGRAADQFDRLSREYGVHLPGPRKDAARREAERDGLRVKAATRDRIAAFVAA